MRDDPPLASARGSRHPAVRGSPAQRCVLAPREAGADPPGAWLLVNTHLHLDTPVETSSSPPSRAGGAGARVAGGSGSCRGRTRTATTPTATGRRPGRCASSRRARPDGDGPAVLLLQPGHVPGHQSPGAARWWRAGAVRRRLATSRIGWTRGDAPAPRTASTRRRRHSLRKLGPFARPRRPGDVRGSGPSRCGSLTEAPAAAHPAQCPAVGSGRCAPSLSRPRRSPGRGQAGAGVARAGDAVVRVEATGICGSDLHIYHGRVRSSRAS